jgi:hypothetical protein
MQFPIDRAWPLDTVSGLKVTLLPTLTGVQVTKKKLTMKLHKSGAVQSYLQGRADLSEMMSHKFDRFSEKLGGEEKFLGRNMRRASAMFDRAHRRRMSQVRRWDDEGDAEGEKRGRRREGEREKEREGERERERGRASEIGFARNASSNALCPNS